MRRNEFQGLRIMVGVGVHEWFRDKRKGVGETLEYLISEFVEVG